MKSPLLRTEGLSTGYRNSSGRGREITRNFSAEIFAGEMVCLLGGNGSGKSTLLRTLGGFLPPLEGRIFLEGRPLEAYTSPERARKIGVVHTANPPVPYMTVEDLVLTGRHPYTAWHGKVSSEDREIRDRTLHFLGLRNLRKRRVEELSDGERRRAWLGRALAQNTPLLLLDEPLAFIDLPGGAEILSLLRRLAVEEGRGILFSSHQLRGALERADRTWLLTPSGECLQGLGEDLLLRGDLERAYLDNSRNASEVRFSREEALFFCPSSEEAERKVLLSGRSGAVRKWTRTALERRGFCPVSEPLRGIPRVEIRQNLPEESPVWYCSREGKKILCISLEEVLRFVDFRK